MTTQDQMMNTMRGPHIPPAPIISDGAIRQARELLEACGYTVIPPTDMASDLADMGIRAIEPVTPAERAGLGVEGKP